MALFKPEDYASTLTSARISALAFGGSFLMMVFWKFFVDAEKDTHWVGIIEQPLAKIGKIDSAQVALTMIAMFITSKFLPPDTHASFWVAGMAGVVTYIITDGLGAIMEETEASVVGKGAQAAAKSGLALFLYLEVLDASFSFDGVIAAFALTNNIFLIAAGLGIGAMFVRSLTIMLVEKGTLEKFKYLEHSAFCAIGTLAAIMFVSTFHEIPEAVTGLTSAAIIALVPCKT